MKEIRTFRDFIEARYDNELWKVVASFIAENPGRLECRSYRVPNPDEAELSDLHIKRVSVRDTGGTGIAFDVLTEAEIEVAETVHRNRESDSVFQWFKVSCTGDLDDGLHNFAMCTPTVYTGSRKLPDGAMSGDLVPYIYKEKLDAVAEDFLRRHCPEALERPMPLPVMEIARRMNLAVEPEHLSKNLTVFGQIYFADCQIECYDKEARDYKPKPVKRGTILYDPDVFFMRNLGCVNNTIIHECVHWDKHKKAFELQKLCNEAMCTIRCQVVEGSQPNNKSSPAEWMEWQARALTPRILMPRIQAGIKAKELIAKYKQERQTDNTADVMEPVILELAEFFSVSRASAKIRMVDLGYEEAMGVFVYSDDRYVPAHSFAKGTLQTKQTFTIEAQDALFEYATNLDLRTVIDSGKYLYVDSHYCINDPKYIRQNDWGHPELTEYANSHIDECCLVFDLEVSPNKTYGLQYYTECVLYKNAASQYNIDPKYKRNNQNQKVEQTAITIFSDENKEATAMLQRLPGGFSEAVTALMTWRGLSEQDLADRCYVDEKTIQRMRTGKNVRLRSIVAVCVGMQLPPVISLELVRKAGHSLTGKPEYIAFHQILSSQYKNSILECNELMEACGFEPLSKI